VGATHDPQDLIGTIPAKGCDVDTIVIGAGVIGLGIAWRVAQQGRTVVVIDRDQPGHGASFHAAGMLAPITEATYGEESLLRLNLASARRYPSFLAELEATSGQSLRSNAPGTLFVALDRDQAEALARLAELQSSLGLDSRWLDARACREREPALHPALRAALLAPEQEVDPRALTAALAAAVVAAGGTIRPGAEVTRLVRDGEPAPGEPAPGEPAPGEPAPGEPASGEGAVRGVELTGGERLLVDPGGTVVLAAGCWSGGIDGVPAHVAAAVRPVKGQILRMRPRPGDPPPLRHLVRTEEVYLVPRGGGEVVIGATVEEQGFDRSLTGGGVYELLRAAIEVVPAVRDLELVEATAGLRPGTRDNGPLLGEAEPGLLVATGHYRNGILLTPATADAIAALIAGKALPGEVAPFSPGRFAPPPPSSPPSPASPSSPASLQCTSR
jgi:glycine oxidase